jgi:hypothetical protein
MSKEICMVSLWLGIIVGFCAGLYCGVARTRSMAIDAGVAYYNQETAEFTWAYKNEQR